MRTDITISYANVVEAPIVSHLAENASTISILFECFLILVFETAPFVYFNQYALSLQRLQCFDRFMHHVAPQCRDQKKDLD